MATVSLAISCGAEKLDNRSINKAAKESSEDLDQIAAPFTDCKGNIADPVKIDPKKKFFKRGSVEKSPCDLMKDEDVSSYIFLSEEHCDKCVPTRFIQNRLNLSSTGALVGFAVIKPTTQESDQGNPALQEETPETLSQNGDSFEPLAEVFESYKGAFAISQTGQLALLDQGDDVITLVDQAVAWAKESSDIPDRVEEVLERVTGTATLQIIPME